MGETWNWNNIYNFWRANIPRSGPEPTYLEAVGDQWRYALVVVQAGDDDDDDDDEYPN